MCLCVCDDIRSYIIKYEAVYILVLEREMWWHIDMKYLNNVAYHEVSFFIWESYIVIVPLTLYVWDAVSIFNHLPRMFLSTDFVFRITDWTCCHGPHLHAILRIISRGASGLATDSPCGVWGRGWATCLLHDSPPFGSHFKMRVGM